MSPDDEREAFWRALHLNSDRITELEAVVNTRNEMMRESIQSAVREAMPSALLSEDEHRWVKLAIQAQAERAALRRAVIEKSLLGLIWSGVIAAGLIIREYAVAHGMWRP
jgi:hypothetical protein